ncbi:hypothetical protein IJH33_02020, partial [Candidatus Saccharibacteria bacterium]|nr:hypothetical protein [Candidatus Saccharibacteria bacterium]
TIILPANVLNALRVGEHSFEAWFSEPESGTARASFKIVEESVDEEENVPVPNTGVFTGEGGSAEIANNFVATVVVSGIVVVAGVLMKKTKRENG